jgi:hypothetical protein
VTCVVKEFFDGGDSLGALSVSWVLDDQWVVGDNDLDWVTPV